MENQSTTPQPAWYVLCVRPNAERHANTLLREAGFETCLPTQRVRSKRQDRQAWIEKVLFNCYVFVHCLPKDRKKVFLDKKRIFRFLSEGNKPITLRDSEVQIIKGLEASQIPATLSQDDLRAGEAVRIVSGNFEGLIGKVLSWQAEQNKVYLEMNGLQCKVCLHLHETNLERV
jgi:transcriptional antiterminator NusG